MWWNLGCLFCLVVSVFCSVWFGLDLCRVSVGRLYNGCVGRL